MTDQELMKKYPAIRWRDPQCIKRTDGLTRYACRFCIAHVGLRARQLGEVGFAFKDEEQCRHHIQQYHLIHRNSDT